MTAILLDLMAFAAGFMAVDLLCRLATSHKDEDDGLF